MTIQAARAMAGGIRQPPAGSDRPRATQDPYGPAGTRTCARSIHPMNGRLGFAMSGFRPKVQARTYQMPMAARRSWKPAARSRLRTAPAPSRSVTATGVSQTDSRFGNRKASGLAPASGRTPRSENSSRPHGSSATK